MGRDLPSILRQTRSYHCLNCGKCTAACPLPEVKAGYSPRRIVARSVLGSDGSGEGAWSCLTCGACRSVCPMDVDYTGFVRQVRQEGLERGEGIPCTHAGIFQCVPRMHASSDRTQDRMAWITPDLEVATRGEIVLFVGCLPYYDEVFSWLGIASTDIARSAVRILNRLGIRPAILPAERCCGHDAYWNGETETFRRLAERNIETLRSAGAKTVLATCPECFLSLSKLYPSVGKLPFEVRHFY
ncbi:MAG: (Fe-S)-binding protein, partial [Planctomycetes bacterium]|nr:(Fe-S)-binding protein [Planctomycetota bacterium]